MTRRIKLLSSSLALTVAVSAAGLSLHAEAGMDARAGMPVSRVFTEADANGDGSVTQDELRSFVTAQFEEMDGDGDGRVSEDVFVDYIAEQREARVRQRFEQLDQNGDGALSPEEFQAARERAGVMRDRDGEEVGERLFRRLDANDDEALQPIEVTSFADRMFARADANADGRVTQAELRERRGDRDDWHHGHHKAAYGGRGHCR
jgi:Ca2+-binding EF-hand superfamily protein